MDETAKKYAAEIGWNIKHYREKANITQQKLSDLINDQKNYKLIDEQNIIRNKKITRDSIAKYEGGTVLPPIDNIAAIAKALGISFWSLMPLEYNEVIRTAADNTVELFRVMMDCLGCFWTYNENTEKYYITGNGINGSITSADIVNLANKTQQYYKNEMLELLEVLDPHTES